ncbi:MAG: HYR domain-containing protein, partial [Erythrobacter sp.]|nr:HYR domain-containing protein [Erythrobacter sp.]
MTVVDTQAPTISCVQNASRDTNPGGLTYTVVGNEFDTTFSDNSDNADLTNDFNGTSSLAGAVLPLGDTLVTWTVADGNENSNSCAMTVTVVDTEVPTISCVEDTNRATDPGGLTYTVVGNEFDASFSDNAADATFTNDLNGTASLAGAVLPLGATLVTWTVVDGSGNSNSCQVTVTVADTEAPSISCVQDTSRPTDPGFLNYTAVGTEFDASFADNSGNANMTNDFNDLTSLAGAVFPLGDTLVTWTVVDGNGNSNSCAMTVTVADTEAPSLSCSENLSLTVSSSSCTIPVIFNTPVVQDNASPSGSVIQTAGLPSGSEFPVGTTTNTFEATDAEGNTSTCSFNVTVTVAESLQDIISEITGDVNMESFGARVSMSADGLRMAVTYTNPSNSAKQVRVYQWNGCGWVQLGADIIGEAEGDNFVSSVSMNADGSRLAVGATLNSGDSGYVQVYTWDGTTWVQLGASIPSEELDGSFNISVSISADGSRLVIGKTVQYSSETYSNNVQVYAWNGSNWIQMGSDIGNESPVDSWAGFGYSVSMSADGLRLAIGAPDDNNPVSANGYVQVYTWDGSNWVQLGSDIIGEAESDYSGVSVSISADGSRLAIGAELNADGRGHVRVYTWDGNNWIQLGADIDGEALYDFSGRTIDMNADGSRLAIGADSDDNGSMSGHVRVYTWDGSNWIQLVADIDGESAFDMFGSSISMSADGLRLAIGAPYNGNNGIQYVGRGHVRVYNLPDTPPVAMCQDITVNLDSNGAYTLNAADIDNGSFDNNGPVTLSIAPVSFDCTDIGTPVTVTLTVTDSIGQTATCTATVTVEDNEAPVITCAVNDTRSTDAGASVYTVQGTEFDATFTDNCTNATLTNDFNGTASLAGAVLPLGDTVVTWTVVDGNENSNSCAMTVTVVDTEAPDLSCSENLSLTVPSSSCTIPVIFNTPVVHDNASPSGSVIQTAGLPSGSEFPVGTTTNTFEATDAAGNTSTCSFDVTVTVAESLQDIISEITGDVNMESF